MKTVWFVALAITASTSVLAQSTIYKHVDESGRVTYSNKPIKGATVMELDPIVTLPASQPAAVAPQKVAASTVEARQQVAVLTPVGVQKTSLASVEPQLQRRRDEERRRILEQELGQEEESLTKARTALTEEQQNPTLVAAVRMAQQATDPTASQMLEFRSSIEKVSGRIRGLQATVAEHEKNVEALRKELGSLK